MRLLVHGVAAHQVSAEVLDSMFRLRCRVFNDLLQWDVSVSDGRERDRFDDLQPIYLILVDGGTVIGSARLLQTTGPNMIKDVFHGLLAGQQPPASPRIWESTRFVTDRDVPTALGPSGVGLATSHLLAGMWELALHQSIERILSVFEVKVSRVLRRAGCKIEPLGRRSRIGQHLVTAGSFPVTQAILARIRSAGGIEHPVLPSLCSGPSLCSTSQLAEGLHVNAKSPRGWPATP